MKLKARNITLENVKKSNYWKLISILVWNHYSEKRFQEESKIDIKEDWYGKCNNGGSYAQRWNNPNFSEEGYVRTLNSIVITFTRNDYITYIYIHVDGNIHCFGKYTNKKDIEEYKRPNYTGAERNLDITNWLLENNFISIIN